MSEISNITTSSNKFVYSQSELPEPTQGVNYFGISWFPVKSIHKHFVFTGYQLIPDVYTIDSNRSFVLFHVYGYIDKQIQSTVARYSLINVQDDNDMGTYVPANPYAARDYFDFMYVRPIDRISGNSIVGYRIGIYSHATDGKVIKNETFTADITVDILAP